MGLDIRLSRKTYVKNWERQTPNQKHTITITGPAAAIIDLSKIAYIEEELMYWRKANAIHNFFTDDAYDNGSDLYVDPSRLQELHDICQRIIDECPLEDGIINNGKSFINGEWVYNTEPGKVLSNQELAQELLSTADGFFFGSTDYDEYYLSSIQDTRDFLFELMKKPNWQHGDYYYNANW